MFISSSFEMRDKLIWPLLEYWINVMIYINTEIVNDVIRVDLPFKDQDSATTVIVYQFKSNLCDTWTYVGYTRGHS